MGEALTAPELTRRPPANGGLRGRVLGPYRLVTELGAGGMGTVWFAEHVSIGRRVAIKVLHPELSADPEPLARFVREARAVNAIRHPNIVDITDIGEQDGLSFLVMELLEGETLGARLERGNPSVDDAVAIAKQIVLALSAAHGQGIVHRDLKPENIFLCAGDDEELLVKVLDFGIAKLGTDGGFGGGGTRPGLVLGTPLYMSPEQCMGDRSLDGRSDQYSLGVVLYEMLVGAPPFESDSFGRLVVMHSHEAPTPPCEHDPSIPEPVSDVVLRALAKSPSDRFESADALAEALELAIQGEPISPEVAAKLDLERRQGFAVAQKLQAILRRRFAYGRAELPGIPVVVAQCLQMLQDENTDLAKVARSLELDPLVASRLVRVVNSPIYGRRGKIASVQQAVSRLGIKRTRSILLELSVRRVFTSRDPQIRSIFRALWEHCVAVGTLARGLAQHVTDAPPPDVAYLAGLLHDVGKPIVAAFLLDAERALLDSLGESWMADTLWLRVVEQTHHEAGLALARQWDLPETVLSAIEGIEDYDRRQPGSCVNIVRYANALARLEGLDAGQIDRAEAERSAIEGRTVLGISEDLEAQLTSELANIVRSMTAA